MMTCAIYLMILFPKIAARPRRKGDTPRSTGAHDLDCELSICRSDCATLPLTATGQPSAWP